MKPIVFDTVIDGQVYEFRIYGGPTLYSVYAYQDDAPIKRAYGETEEKAILQLVKLLEK